MLTEVVDLPEVNEHIPVPWNGLIALQPQTIHELNSYLHGWVIFMVQIEYKYYIYILYLIYIPVPFVWSGIGTGDILPVVGSLLCGHAR